MRAMAGIVSYGSYVPYRRLKRSAIAAVLGTPAGKGERAIASFDEVVRKYPSSEYAISARRRIDAFDLFVLYREAPLWRPLARHSF